MARSTDSDMYSGTPCDQCGGPTLALPMGSIWCPAEDPHPGGHFVVRLMFERNPVKQAAFDALHAHTKRTSPRTSTTPATSVSKAPRPVAKPKVADPYASGFDAFIGKDK